MGAARAASRGRPARRADGPVARQVLALQLLVLLVVVAGATVLAVLDARGDARDEAEQRALVVARSVADSPTVVRAVGGEDPTAVLQPYAEQVRRDTDVDFVVVMTPRGIRWTHPDPEEIGRRFIGGLGGAPEGRIFTQQFTGTLGPSLRAVVPVVRGRDVVALVSVGVTVAQVREEVVSSLLPVGGAALAALVVGGAGAYLIGRRLRRQTHGLGEREITRMFEYYRAVLRAVREGLLLVDHDGRVQLVNDEARRLLVLPDDVEGQLLDELGLPPGLAEAVRAGRADSDTLYVAGSHVLVASVAPAQSRGALVGAVLSVRDRTDLQRVTGELDLSHRLTDALRAQNHEAANRLHSVVSLIELGMPERAAAFATAELRTAQGLADEVLAATGEPVLAALLLAKSAEASERGIALSVESGVEGSLPDLPSGDLVTVVGNLLDNAFEALASVAPVRGERRRVAVDVSGDPARLEVVVGDSGPGLSEEQAERALGRGWSTKAEDGHGLGLALVAQVARRHGGEVTLGRSPLGGAEVSVLLRAPAHDGVAP